MSSLLSCVNVKSYFHAVKGHKVKMHAFLTLWWCRSMEEKEKRKNTMSLNEFNVFCIFHLHQVFLIVDVLITSFSIRCWNPALQNLLFRLCYCRNTSQQQCKNEQQQSERLLLLFLQQLRQMLIWFSSKKEKVFLFVWGWKENISIDSECKQMFCWSVAMFKGIFSHFGVQLVN